MAEIEPKFYVGDVVRIRDFDAMGADRFRDPSSIPFGLGEGMRRYCCREVTIKKCKPAISMAGVKTVEYWFEEFDTTGHFRWSEPMLESIYVATPVSVSVENLTSLWE